MRGLYLFSSSTALHAMAILCSTIIEFNELFALQQHGWHTLRMQGCVIHWGMKTVGWEPSWCRLYSEYH